MMAVISRLRSVWSATRDVAGHDLVPAGEGDSAEEPHSNLFHCSECGVVYVAVEKESCSNCDVEVEQVRSTLSCR